MVKDGIGIEKKTEIKEKVKKPKEMKPILIELKKKDNTKRGQKTFII
jgi:hypothetical protein